MKINVAYAINEGYVNYCIVSMASLIENNRKADIHFHILTDNLSENAIHKLERFVTSENALISFHIVPDIYVSDLTVNDWSKHAWFRLFLPDILDESIDRVLYLDTDTIVCGDLSDLFTIDLGNYSIAGCMDYMGFKDGIYKRLGYPESHGYICSGVLVMNLKYFREHDLSRRIIGFARKNPELIQFPDQDAINYICHTSIKLLPLKYDMLAPFFTDKEFIRLHENDVREMLQDPKIIHYAGCNPWKKECARHFYYDDFWKYAPKAGGIMKISVGGTGFGLLKYRIKTILGIMGFEKFSNYRPKPTPDFTTAERLKNESES